MDYREIKELLDRYLEGDTTLQEERRLAEYFKTDEVDPEFESYRNWFRYVDSEKKITSDRSMLLPTRKRHRTAWISAAAAVVVLMGIGTFAWNAQTKAVTADEFGTYNDPEIAMKETRKALELLSGKVNTGRESVGYLGNLEQSKNAIFKN